MMKCNECGKTFTYGNGPDGLPNGIGFVLEEGSRVDICKECVMKAGMEHDYENMISKYNGEAQEAPEYGDEISDDLNRRKELLRELFNALIDNGSTYEQLEDLKSQTMETLDHFAGILIRLLACSHAYEEVCNEQFPDNALRVTNQLMCEMRHEMYKPNHYVFEHELEEECDEDD